MNEKCVTPSWFIPVPLLEHTPWDAKEVINYDEHLCITIEGTELPKDLSECLQHHIKKSTVTAYSWTLAEQDLEFTHVYQLAKHKQNSLSDTVAVKSEVVTAGMVHAKKHKQEKNEVIKA